MAFRQVSALYCDDVRQEVGGKITYVGAYQSELWLPSFPALLPKLCIAYWIQIPLNDYCDSLMIRVMKDDDVVYEEAHDLGSPQHDAFYEEQATLGHDLFMQINSSIVFSPLTLEAPCVFRVRVITSDGKELKANGLRITTAPEGTFADT